MSTPIRSTTTAARSKPSTEDLVRKLLDGRTPPAADAVSALVGMGADPAEVAPALFAVAADRMAQKFEGVRSWIWGKNALEAMGTEALPTLIDKLASADTIERETALNLLYALGPEAKSAVPAIVEALSTPGDDLSLHDAVLRKIGVPDADGIQALVNALESDSHGVRVRAAEALQEYGPACKDYALDLIAVLDRWDHPREDDIEHTLAAIGPPSPQGMNALIKILSHETEATRFKAIGVLTSYGALAAPALSELARLAKSGYTSDAIRAREAIEVIEQE